MANNSLYDFDSDEDKGNSVINQFGNPIYDNFLIFNNEIDSNCNDVENQTCFESDTNFQSHDSVTRPKPRERTTIKKKNGNDIVYSNVPLIDDKYNTLTSANLDNDCVTQVSICLLLQLLFDSIEKSLLISIKQSINFLLLQFVFLSMIKMSSKNNRQ